MAYQRICAVYGDQDDEPDLDELKKDERVTCMLGTVKKVSSDNVSDLYYDFTCIAKLHFPPNVS